jgi:hypothetical protein
MAQPQTAAYYQTLKTCYFTLENGDKPNALHTCGDRIRAKVHLHPSVRNETLSVSNLRVNFKCKVRTVIVTGGGNNRRTHKSSIYLFWFSTEIIRHRNISINAPQSWDVEFEFPWAVAPHPSQNGFRQNALFKHQAGHPLPPTWSRDCLGHNQTVQYYLESVVTRQGRMMEHGDKGILPLRFSPPLRIPDPPPALMTGMRGRLLRTSRLLDPAKRDEHYGFRERTKNLFSSDPDPIATFFVTASAPTVCCVGDSLPVTLHIQYDQRTSTAPEQPEVTLKFFHVRLTDTVQYRVSTSGLLGDSELQRASEEKILIANRAVHPEPIVYEGMSLNEIAPVPLRLNVGASFATFSVNKSYMLKISAIFHCVGKDFDITLLRHRLTVHPPRTLHRVPVIVLDPVQSSKPQGQGPSLGEETLPPYVAGSAEGRAELPSYEEGAFEKLHSPAIR